MKLAKLEPVVKEVLENNTSAREDDHYLYIKVITKMLPAIAEMSFKNIFIYYREYGLPPLESVSRCRRKLQRQYPNLQASDKVAIARTDKQLEFIDYSR